jgi:O-antigen ligase
MKRFAFQNTASRESQSDTHGARPVASLFFVLTLAGLTIVEAVRDGGFWNPDALVVAVVAVAFLAIQLARRPRDRQVWAVAGSFSLLALWWFVRAAFAGTASSFLPLGASILGFAVAFVLVHSLSQSQREVAGLFVATLGGVGALIGFAGLTWRWYPMSMPAQNLWRLSTTLTYADAAGAFLAMSLLVALAGGPRLWIARASVCLCTGGLLATQRRGALVAFVVACAFVPWRQYVSFLVPLLAGVVLGVAAVATSPSSGSVAWLGVATISALVISLVWVPKAPTRRWPRRQAVILAVLALGALAGVALLLHSEIALRALAPSDQDRAVEWSAAWHQFESNPLIGVGPDRILHFHAVDGTRAYFAHNEYLQVAADSGLVGLALLALGVGALVKRVKRFDTLSSCAVGALVCFAVAGAFDFDWHLTFLGLLGGWVAGLATRTVAPGPKVS